MPAMDVLVIGGGGREHALCWALCASPVLGRLFCAPGNAGIAEIAKCVDIDITDHDAVIAFCREASVGFVVVGPEAPLVAGIADDLMQAGIAVFGPSKNAARLEGSKAFTKDICDRYAIPTAAYANFSDIDAAKVYVRNRGAPIVIKADGLAAGKGVVVAETLEDALSAIDMLLADGGNVVIEDFMQGEEASFFALSDGVHVLALTTAQDHKRAFDGDKGPNTGGMGAYSPASIMTRALIDQTMETIIRPTVRGMSELGMPYKGVLYAGLMLTPQGPRLVEYNIRFGDPECQVMMPRLKDDLLLLLKATTDGTIDKMSARWYPQAALGVVMAANGYPGPYETGTAIAGLTEITEADAIVFHAGTAHDNGQLVATGGRVLCVTALGDTVGDAAARAYGAVARIDWPGGFNRSDIGWREIARESGETS